MLFELVLENLKERIGVCCMDLPLLVVLWVLLEKKFAWN
jgi:hypothetical protein